MPDIESPKKRTDPLVDAARALTRGEWKEARQLYRTALDGGETPDALEGSAIASWWENDIDAAIKARERAYELRSARGDTVEAARLAGFLAWDYSVLRGKQAVANGWLQRARRLAEELEPIRRARVASADRGVLPLGYGRAIGVAAEHRGGQTTRGPSAASTWR